MKQKGIGFSLTTRALIIASVFLFAVNILMGSVMLSLSKSAMKTLISQRMLDIVNTAADMLDGDELEALTAADKGTEAYQHVHDILTYFQSNIDLEFIYTVRDMKDGTFTFIIDPALHDASDFGELVHYTDALYQASLGIASVDEEPYTDDYGKFYSAYSPVFDSAGEVGGMVVVDFSAAWYDQQIRKNALTILTSSILSLLIGALIVLLITSELRKRFRELNTEVSALAVDLEDLTSEIRDSDADSASEAGIEAAVSKDEVAHIGARIRDMRVDLGKYLQHLQTQESTMLNALTADYRGIFYVNLDSNDALCYRAHPHMVRQEEGHHFPFQYVFQVYANKVVTEEYRESFLEFVKISSLRETLARENLATLRYSVMVDGKKQYEMLRVTAIRQDEPDGKVHRIAVGFADVDASARTTMEAMEEVGLTI